MIVMNILLGERGHVVRRAADLAAAVKLLAIRANRCSGTYCDRRIVMKVGFVGLGQMGSGMAASSIEGRSRSDRL